MNTSGFYVVEISVKVQQVEPMAVPSPVVGQPRPLKLVGTIGGEFKSENPDPALGASVAMLKLHKFLASQYGPIILTLDNEERES